MWVFVVKVGCLKLLRLLEYDIAGLVFRVTLDFSASCRNCLELQIMQIKRNYFPFISWLSEHQNFSLLNRLYRLVTLHQIFLTFHHLLLLLLDIIFNLLFNRFCLLFFIHLLFFRFILDNNFRLVFCNNYLLLLLLLNYKRWLFWRCWLLHYLTIAHRCSATHFCYC